MIEFTYLKLFARNNMSDSLIFIEQPHVVIATNHFIWVPIILMFEDTGLLEVEKVPQSGFTTRYSIFHPDGTYLAKVVGPRLFLTDNGAKAGLTLRHPAGMTVCELAGKTLFEIRRTEAAALKTEAELYSHTGQFIRATDSGLDLFTQSADKEALKIGTLTAIRTTFQDCDIGIRLRQNGGVSVGVSREALTTPPNRSV